MNSIYATPNLLPLSDTEVQDLQFHLEGIQQILTTDKGLTKKERRRMMRLSRENRLFVADSVDAIDHIPELCPRMIDPENVKSSFELFTQLRYFEQAILQITEALKDRRLNIGNQCFRDGLMIYQVTKMAAKAGYPKARPIYDQMRQRFKYGNLKHQEEPIDEENLVEEGLRLEQEHHTLTTAQEGQAA